MLVIGSLLVVRIICVVVRDSWVDATPVVASVLSVATGGLEAADSFVVVVCCTGTVIVEIVVLVVLVVVVVVVTVAGVVAIVVVVVVVIARVVVVVVVVVGSSVVVAVTTRGSPVVDVVDNITCRSLVDIVLDETMLVAMAMDGTPAAGVEVVAGTTAVDPCNTKVLALVVEVAAGMLLVVLRVVVVVVAALVAVVAVVVGVADVVVVVVVAGSSVVVVVVATTWGFAVEDVDDNSTCRPLVGVVLDATMVVAMVLSITIDGSEAADVCVLVAGSTVVVDVLGPHVSHNTWHVVRRYCAISRLCEVDGSQFSFASTAQCGGSVCP